MLLRHIIDSIFPHAESRRCAHFLRAVLTLPLLIAFAGVCPSSAQTPKGSPMMLIEGTIHVEDVPLPSGTIIRVLRKDSSIVKSTFPYALQPNQFGVRLSSAEGFQPGDPVLFRIVLSSVDSFIGRSINAPVRFANSIAGTQREIFPVQLIRNHKTKIERGVPDTTIREGRTFIYKVFSRDIDLDRLTYTIHEGPKGMEIGPSTGILQWTPSFEDSGSYRVVVGVGDGYDWVETTPAVIRVRNVNRPPVIVLSPTAGTVREGESMFLEVQAVDPDRDSLSYWILDASGKFNFPTPTGQYILTPSFDDSGVYAFTALATDGSLSDTSNVFRITVVNVNRPPMISPSALDTVIDENQEIQIQYTHRDPDGDSTEVALLDAPLGVEFDEDGKLTWKPNFQQAGEYTVVVSASDPLSNTESRVHIVVRNINHLPTPVELLSPGLQDTLRLDQTGRFIEFSWTNAIDEDADDVVRYDLHIVGAALDTVFPGIVDTTIAIGFRSKLQSGKNYSWFVVVTDGHDQAASMETHTFRILAPAIAAREPVLPPVPKRYGLQQTIPDAASTVANIRYTLPERSQVQLSLYNMVGEKLKQLVSEEKDPGVYDLDVDTSTLTNGVYLVELQAHPLGGSRTKDFVSTKKLVLVR